MSYLNCATLPNRFKGYKEDEIMNILGLSDGHDSGACLLKDSELVYAANEERLSRNKMHMGFPKLTIQNLLEYCNLRAEEIDYVAVGTLSNTVRSETGYTGTSNVGIARSLYELTSKHFGNMFEKKWFVNFERLARLLFRRKWQLQKQLKELGISATFAFYDHHLTHASCAYFTSGFEECVILTADGGGDGLSGVVFLGKDGKVIKKNACPFIHSVGNFWMYITIICGFNPWRHGGKITGLAAYEQCDEAYNLLTRLYSHSKKIFTSLIKNDFFFEIQYRI